MRLFFLFVMAATLAVSGCSRLPGGAPLSKNVLADVKSEYAPFDFYNVTEETLVLFSQWPDANAGKSHNWIPARPRRNAKVIAVSDQVSLKIWDSSQDSLLTPPTNQVANITNVEVAQDGTIFVPYVGHVKVSGLSAHNARQKLQNAIGDIIPAAQVQINVNEGRNSSISLVNGVARPGTYPLPDQDFALTDLIAESGGIDADLVNPQVRLIRNGRVYQNSIDKVFSDPSSDTRLVAGDRLIIEGDDRYFLSFGATNKEAQHTFTSDTLSAMDAMAIVGGFQDRTADPKGVLVMRQYKQSRPSGPGPQKPNVVFAFDLTGAAGLFAASNFEMQSKDLLIATESPLNDVSSLASLLNQFFGVINRAQNAVN